MQARRPRGDQLADLADLVMTVARAVKAHVADDPSVFELSVTEVTVLRYLDHHPDVSPSTVAAATGLQRSNLSRALRVARQVESGVISINTHSSVHTEAPFGGFKRSGLGRDLGMSAMEACTEIKNIYVGE